MLPAAFDPPIRRDETLDASPRGDAMNAGGASGGGGGNASSGTSGDVGSGAGANGSSSGGSSSTDGGSGGDSSGGGTGGDSSGGAAGEEVTDGGTTDAVPDVPDADAILDRGPHVLSMSLGEQHTCAILDDGILKCWGRPFAGRLGNANDGDTLGDDETPRAIPPVEVGGPVIEVAAGNEHTCALLVTGDVRCWGLGEHGRLGYGNESNVGDNELPSMLDPVNVGGTVVQIATGGEHTCALLDTGEVKCWGRNHHGQLGLGHEQDINILETPAQVAPIVLGGLAIQIAAGEAHTCALLDTGGVRCWGNGAAGRLGYPYHRRDLGDDEMPDIVGDVVVGGLVTSISTGAEHTCAILEGGAVRCWGFAGTYRLGNGLTGFPGSIGDGETPVQAPPVDLGKRALQVAAAADHTCALLEGGTIKCWGEGALGRLGLASTLDGAVPAEVDVGGIAIAVRAGSEHTCALLDTHELVCWGMGFGGRLGHASSENIGDDETPASALPVEF